MPAPRTDQLLADQQGPSTDRQDLEVLLRKAAAILITKSPQQPLPEDLSSVSSTELQAHVR